jgi:hypothetical protein
MVLFFELVAYLNQTLVLIVIESEKSWLDVLPSVSYNSAGDSHGDFKMSELNPPGPSGVGKSRSHTKRNPLSRREPRGGLAVLLARAVSSTDSCCSLQSHAIIMKR